MAKRKELTPTEMGRKRWEGISAEERREICRKASLAAATARSEKARLRREAAERSVA